MRYSKTLITASLAGLAMAAFTTAAWSQGAAAPAAPAPQVLGGKFIAVDGYKYGGGLPVGAEKNLDALRLLIKAANAMGQMRDNQYGGATYLVLGDTTNSMRIVANGTMNGQKAHVIMDWDYRTPGVRLDVQSPDGKSRTINVVAAKLAWDEKTPGVFGGAAKTSINERLVMAYLMPSAVILTARDAADKIKLSKNGARDAMTIPVPVLGTDLVATLNADGRPIHTEIKLDGKLYTGDFEDFLNDRMDMEVIFPHKVALKLDGKPIADLVLEWHQANPYLIFPVPKEVAAK